MVDLLQQINLIDNIDEMLAVVFQQVTSKIACDQAIIFLREKNYLTIASAHGVANLADIQTLSVELYQSDFAQPLVKNFTPLLTADLQQENTWFKDVTDTASRSWLGVPLVATNSLLGIITVASKRPGLFTERDLQALHSIAGQAANAIRNANLRKRLQNMQQCYTSLFEESSDLLLIIDTLGIILDANRKACQIFRRPKDVLIGSHVALLDPTLDEAFQRLRDALKTREEITDDLTAKDAYGQTVALEITARRVQIDGSLAIQWVGRDLTARHQLANLRKDLTNMIVHDLRGPLGTLLGTIQMLSMLLEDVADTPMYKEAMDLINIANRSGQYLNDLIDSVLDIRNLEHGNAPLTIAAVDLNTLFAEVAEQTAPQAEAKKNEVKFPSVESKIIVNIDYGMIRRVLVNLVDNAIKYTPAGGKIQVDFKRQDHQLVFIVADDGPGIPPENQKHIFDKFTRATADATIQGVGLGLAFCKLAVEAHRGTIWLESEVGVGSTFIFSIADDLPLS